MSPARKMAAQALGEGISPLELMLHGMRKHFAVSENEELSDDRRDAALNAAHIFARDAAPYLHAKLAAVTHSGDADDPITVVIRRLTDSA